MSWGLGVQMEGGGGEPEEFDHLHILMWLCQMMYAEVILEDSALE